jgi:hypothetical protein
MSEVRHRALIAEVRGAIAARPMRAATAVDGAYAAAMHGDHATAIARARALLEAHPEHKVGHMFLAVELCLRGEPGDLEAARTSAGWLERTTMPLPGFLQAAALVRLLDGDRAAADRMSRRAERMLTGYGFAPDALPLTAALRAALAGDRATVERLRQLPGAHFDPASALWARLT